MIVSGISAEDLEAARDVASRALGNEIVFSEFESYSPTRHRVRLRVENIDGPGTRRRQSLSYFYGWVKAPRRSRHPCGHAYGMLFVTVFERAPQARIQTAFATYHGARDFLETYEYVLARNVGSVVYSLAYCDECTCETNDIQTDTIEGWYIGRPAMPSPENTQTVALGHRG
jgi:hypothetical protein